MAIVRILNLNPAYSVLPLLVASVLKAEPLQMEEFPPNLLDGRTHMPFSGYLTIALSWTWQATLVKFWSPSR